MKGQARAMKSRGVIFDLDGTLVETEELKAEAHAAAVNRLGGDVRPSLYAKVVGRPHSDVRSTFLQAAGIAGDPEEYSRIYGTVYRKLLQTRLQVVAGAYPLLKALASGPYVLALVSSSQRWMIDYILGETRLQGLFQACISANDVAESKPAPDAYLKALLRLDLSPKSVVVVEDSEAGIEAARRANLAVLAVHTTFNREQNLSRATSLIDSLADTAATIQAIESLLEQAHYEPVSR